MRSLSVVAATALSDNADLRESEEETVESKTKHEADKEDGSSSPILPDTERFE